MAYVDSLKVRTDQAVSTRAYGGVATDMNNDGWLDRTIVNEDTADVRAFLNQADGSGHFDPFLQPPAPVQTQASPTEPADFNEDGQVDLAVENIATGRISLLLGNGDGTFAPQQLIDVGPTPRDIAVLDVNGDGHDDVASASKNGAILFGDGGGLLGNATTYATDAFPLATDLGDIDGDGDLDWVTSSFSGDWFLFINNGGGAFTFAQEFDAPLAASCALMLDFDNDGDLDLALIDELADVVILQRNGWYETFLPVGATP